MQIKNTGLYYHEKYTCAISYSGYPHKLSYWRTTSGYEVNVIIGQAYSASASQFRVREVVFRPFRECVNRG